MVRAAKGPRVMADINITPFTDVLLVLLIIFMVSAAAVENGFNVELPRAVSRDEAERSSIVVGLSREGQILLGQSAVSPAELGPRVAQLRQERRTERAILLADRELRYARVVEVMDLLKQAGIKSIGLGAQP